MWPDRGGGPRSGGLPPGDRTPDPGQGLSPPGAAQNFHARLSAVNALGGLKQRRVFGEKNACNRVRAHHDAYLVHAYIYFLLY